MKLLPLLLLLGMFCAAPALANPVAACHCFQNRSFDPEWPAAADPYFLATAHNTFFAAVFGIEKRDVVRQKMSGGTSGDDLWLLHFAADRSNRSLPEIAQARRQAQGWAEALRTLGPDPERMGPRFIAVLSRRGSDAELAAAAADTMLVERLGADSGVVRELRRAEAGHQEVLLALLLSRRHGRPAFELWRQVSQGERTWGSLLDEAKLQAGDFEAEIGGFLQAAAQR